MWIFKNYSIDALQTFSIVFLAELLLNIFSLTVLQQSGNSILRFAGLIIVDILSLPWMLVDRSYPYYAMEPGWFIAIMVITTLLFHALAVYLVYKSVKKQSAK